MFWKYLKETMNGVLNRRNILRERILKNISVYEIHYCKYQLIKTMYKIITSLFLQNWLEAYRNSRIQPNEKVLKRVPCTDQFFKNSSLKLDKTLRIPSRHNIQAAHFYCFKRIQKTGLNLLTKALATSSSYLICIPEKNPTVLLVKF